MKDNGSAQDCRHKENYIGRQTRETQLEPLKQWLSNKRGGDRQSTWEHMHQQTTQAMLLTHRDIWWPAWAHQAGPWQYVYQILKCWSARHLGSTPQGSKKIHFLISQGAYALRVLIWERNNYLGLCLHLGRGHFGLAVISLPLNIAEKR